MQCMKSLVHSGLISLCMNNLLIGHLVGRNGRNRKTCYGFPECYFPCCSASAQKISISFMLESGVLFNLGANRDLLHRFGTTLISCFGENTLNTSFPRHHSIWHAACIKLREWDSSYPCRCRGIEAV